jgi:hypothetical protein
MVSNTNSEQQNVLDGRLITNLLKDTSLECRRIWHSILSTCYIAEQ